MKIIESHLFQPGNIHARRKAIQLNIADAAGVIMPAKAIQEFGRMLRQIRSEVSDCPAWRRLSRAKEPVPVAGVIEVLAVLTQRYALWPVKFCSWRQSATGNHRITPGELEKQGIAVYETRAEAVGLAAGEVAITMAQHMLDGMSANALHDRFIEQLIQFFSVTGHETPSGDCLTIAKAANEKGIPWSVVERSHYMRLGLGRHSHVLKGSESTNTTSIGRALSRDKSMTHRILTAAELPVARQGVTTNAKEAESFVAEIGFPVVVKPRDGNMGRGVSIGIADTTQLRRAFKRAQQVSRHVVIESLIEGEEYRLLVIDGRMVAAAQRRPAQITGDGTSTIRQLVEKENRRPERESALPSSMAIMRLLKLDENALEVLADQGFAPDSIPARDQSVLLRRESNISRGGEGVDITDQIHPDNRALAAQAAAVIGLDVCGVDFITKNPSVSWRENGAAICEVNSRPGIHIHIHAMEERGHQITDAMLNMLFPNRSPVRMPVVALIGTPAQTRYLRSRIEAAATASAKTLGLVCDAAGATSAHLLNDAAALEWDNQIDAAVIETSPQQIAQDGIGVERLDLAVVALQDGSDDDHLAMGAIQRVAQNRIIALDDAAAPLIAISALGFTDQPAPDTIADDTPNYARAVPRKADNPDEFTALFIGDVGFGESYMHHPRVSDLQNILGTHGYGYSLANLHGVLGQSDLTIANLEVPLSARPDAGLQGRKKYLGWCDPNRTVAALQQAGIDAVTLANNHALDCGSAGLAETLSRLQGAGIASFGAGPDADSAAHPMIHRFSVGGIDHSLVVFAGFEHRRRYDRNYRWYAGSGHGGIASISPEMIATQIDALRDLLPNPTFVAFPHWGTDYENITDSQRETASALVAAGVDLIIGHGAHITQPAQIIDGCPVLFNIGNFVWNTPGRFNKRDVQPLGLAVALRFSKRQRTGPSLRIYPILTDNFATGFQNRPVTAEEFASARVLITSQLPSRPRGQTDKVGPYLELKLQNAGGKQAAAQPMAAE